ncbi:MAG: hypothetical protein QOH88_920 [Verrucomicrobiota bacterium]|jgi:hypothetical protein
MTTTRIILAGILGGIAMFLWSAFAHMAVPALGEAGLKELPSQQQQPILAALTAGLGDKPGLYLFPGLGVGENPTKQQKTEAMTHLDERLANNPSGLLMYHPTGSRPLTMGKWLTIEFLKEVLEVILAVFLLAQTRIVSFGGRVGFILVVGIVAAIATNLSYWNWYGFPSVYTAGYMTTQIIGFLCAGLAAAFMLRKSGIPVT